MSEQPRSQRTERPTPRRLKKARERGQVARSRDVPAAFVLGGFLIFVHLFGAGWLERLQGLMALYVAHPLAGSLSDVELAALCQGLAAPLLLLLAAPLGTLAAADLAGNLVQGPLSFSMQPLTPKLDKLNPIAGLKKLLSLRQTVEVLKGLIKMALYGAVTYSAAKDVIVDRARVGSGAAGLLGTLFALTQTVLLRVALLAGLLALFDFLFRRYDHTRNLMMTKREVRDEHKETEGDPLIRSRIRQKQLALARSRMMADVAKATVVVTNPTHYAVALRYVPGETRAPKVLARGRALVAERIRALALAHGVPIVSDPPLARALYRAVPVGGEIPEKLFRAVAEVLALVLAPRARRAEVPR